MARRRTCTLASRFVLLSGGLFGVTAPSIALAQAPEAAAPVAPAQGPPVADPAPAGPPPASDVSGPSGADTGSPPATEGAPPAADEAATAPAAEAVPEGTDPTAVPEPPAEAPPEVAADAEPAATEPEPAEPAVDPSLLDSDQSETAPVGPAPSPRTVEYDMDDPEQAAAQLRAEYANRFRNDGLGGRLNVTAHLQFANMGSRRSPGVGGRMGGGSVDIGAAWNHISVAGTLAGWGGRFYLPEESGAEMNAMFGGGPTLGYGRLALLGRGFFDVRVGYHFYYGVVGARRDGPTVVASQDPGGGVTLTQTENLLPHGPRVRVDMGLLSHANRRYFHAFGLTMGYQGLVHSFRGDLPVTSMLTLGISYWLG